MTIKCIRILSSTFLALALIAAASPAQTTTGAFLGIVTDASGAVIGDAKVTVTNETTGLTRNVTTTSSGEYMIALLPVGRYTLKFEAQNFKARAIKGVVLELDQKAKIDISLEVGEITEVVTSEDSETAPLTRTETAEIGEVIENKRIVDLPLNGRLFLQLAQLT
ncbi:MAG: carboxypeptidase-like regulatory domain-containing protein, partial [Blastocatellia bacterium]